MKRYIRSQECIFAMSKISSKYAIGLIKSDIGKFVYFSEANSSHGPRIKFYGGTKETATTQTAPTLSFDNEGNCQVELAEWMNKKNCPNAFDETYIDGLVHFIEVNLPILLLVWFKHIDEADALAYFHGQIDLNELIDCADVPLLDDLGDNYTLDNVDEVCRKYNYYKF